MPFILLLIALFFIFITPITNMLSRANRNNNPGNLRYAGQAGATGADPDGFAMFASVDLGWAALIRQWQLYANRGYTLQQGISIYAPSSENNTNAYMSYLSNALNVPLDAALSSVDITALAEAVARFEGFISV